MFEQLFQQHDALVRHQQGPLADERRRYLQHLADQGVLRSTLRSVAQYLLVVIKWLRLTERAGESIDQAEIEQQAARWSQRRPRPRRGNRCSRRRFLWHATQWLQFLGRLQPPTPPSSPYAPALKAYADDMLQERGLSSHTIATRVWTVQDFLSRLGLPLRALTIQHVDATLLQKLTQSGYTRRTVQTYADSLRDFFRYAESRGWCAGGLAAAIQAPRIFPQESLPAGPSWEQAQSLIATCQGASPLDLRNRALLLLLVIYGLRAGEVIQLRLEDLDWEAERLSVRRSKNGRVQTYPLCPSVGNAILQYLQQGRPQTAHRELFLTLRAPFRPLSRVALTAMVTRKLKALGVSLAHYGPHALRHCCATHLLQQGLTLKEIGDHLGHQDPDATRLYAKVDLAGLRRVADFDLGGLA